MAAAVQPEVFPRHLDPLEVLWGGQHPLHQLAVLILDPSPLDEGAPRLRDAVGETIAGHLELTEIEDAGRGCDRVDPVRHLGVTEGLAEEPAQLSLEPGDLAAQLKPGLALVDRDIRSVKSPIEETRHP